MANGIRCSPERIAFDQLKPRWRPGTDGRARRISKNGGCANLGDESCDGHAVIYRR